MAGLMTQPHEQLGIQPTPFKTWSKLVSHFERFGSSWMFRGHASAKWPLRSTLDRRTPPNSGGKSSAEHQLLAAFRRRAHNYLDAQHIPTTQGEWLALMQHFGAPTRLLDFTWSPFVAAYFAFEGGGGKFDSCGGRKSDSRQHGLAAG